MVHDYGDEVVAANMETGWFFSFTGAHRSVWCALVDGYAPDEVRAALAADERLPLALEEVLRAAVEGGLLAGQQRAAPAASLATIVWADGSVEAFDDLQDALLLDPVHDASDEGWPYKDAPG